MGRKGVFKRESVSFHFFHEPRRHFFRRIMAFRTAHELALAHANDLMVCERATLDAPRGTLVLEPRLFMRKIITSTRSGGGSSAWKCWEMDI